MNSVEEVDARRVDQIIESLLSVRGSKPGKFVDLKEIDIRFLIDRSIAYFLKQDSLIKIEAPLNVCGDIHGQYYDLLRIFDNCGYPDEKGYLFLGDYVDRGRYCVETMCLLLCYKIKYQDSFHILRGNHENQFTNMVFGFYHEVQKRYNVSLWKHFCNLFNLLPVAALIEERILCMHGGIGPDLTNINQINDIKRPIEIPNKGLLCDLMWSDPETGIVGYQMNAKRGISVVFGENTVKEFCEKNNIDMIIRAHQVVMNGYEFFCERRLLTVFSAPNYVGLMDNCSGIVIIDEDLECSIKVLKPIVKETNKIQVQVAAQGRTVSTTNQVMAKPQNSSMGTGLITNNASATVVNDSKVQQIKDKNELATVDKSLSNGKNEASASNTILYNSPITPQKSLSLHNRAHSDLTGSSSSLTNISLSVSTQNSQIQSSTLIGEVNSTKNK